MPGTPNPAPGFVQNPDKKITIEPHKGRVTVKSKDVVIAASSRAKLLKEDGYAPVLYISFRGYRLRQSRAHDHEDALPLQGRCHLLAPRRLGRSDPRYHVGLREPV